MPKCTPLATGLHMMKVNVITSLILLGIFPVNVFATETKIGPMSLNETIQVYGSFSKLDNRCIREIWSEIPERNAPADRMVADLVEKRLGEYGNGLLILDSGHAHSVAAAVRLAERGFKIKFKMEHDEDFITTFQMAAAIKYNSNRMLTATQLPAKYRGQVIVLDAHRKRDFSAAEFPSPSEIKEKYAGKVIWITEDLRGLNRDHLLIHSTGQSDILRKVLKHYYSWNWTHRWILQYIEDSEIQVLHHFASPYFNGTPEGWVDFSGTLPQSCKEWK